MGALDAWKKSRHYREEVTTILWKLADIDVNVKRILRYLEGDDDEWEEEEEEEPPDA